MTAEPVGTKFYIGPQDTSARSQIQYRNLVYTQVLLVESVPALGPTSSVLRYTPIDDDVVYKRVGATDNGDPELICFLDVTDVGQAAMVAASVAKEVYAFQMTLPDANAVLTHPTTYFFHALVASASTDVGAADNIPRRMFLLPISGRVLEVPVH
jgi:hypothetical protein